LKTAAIYSRVSTSTGQQSTSRQVNELIGYAKTHGYKIAEEDIFEEFRSGYSKKKERVEIERLLELIRSGKKKYKAIFVSEISRIARDPQVGRQIVDELTELNIPVFVKNPALVSIEADGKRSGMFNIIFQILLELANTEAEFMKMRSISGVIEKVRQGGSIGGIMQPYGYTSEKKKLVIEPTEAEVVKMIFNLCIDGNGTKKIANKLNELNIPTKVSTLFDKEMKQRNGRPPIHSKNIKWKDGTIYGILTNPIYKGLRRLIRHDDNEHVQTEFTRNKTYNLFDSPIIVSEEIWNKAQETFKENFRHSIRNKKFHYILKDIVTCAKCGSSYAGRMKTDKRDQFYMCSARRTKTRPCNNPAISIELLESAVWTFLQFNTDVDRLLLDINENYNHNVTEKAKTESEVGQLKELLKIEDGKLIRIKDLYVDGHWTKDEYKKRLNSQSNAIAKINKSILEKEIRINFLNESIKSVTDLGEMNSVKKALLKDRVKISELISKLLRRVSLLVIDRNYAILSIQYKFGEWYYSVLIDRNTKEMIPITYNLANGIDKIFTFDEYGRITNDQETIDEVVSNFSDEAIMGFKEPLLWIPFS
jgi:site-specific DNA recombinase